MPNRNIGLLVFALWSVASAAPFLPHRRKTFRVAAGATQVASDDFSSQSAFTDLGDDADWEAEDGVITVLSGAVVVSNDASNCVYRWVNNSFNADQYSEVTLSTVGTLDRFGAAVRIQDAATCYAVAYDESATTLRLETMSAGTLSNITTTTKNYSNGVKLRIRASGAGTATRLNVWEDTGSGWVQVWTDQNPAVDIDGGRPGLYSISNSNNTRCTLWAGGDWP
jgi:hypothetical protein